MSDMDKEVMAELKASKKMLEELYETEDGLEDAVRDWMAEGLIEVRRTLGKSKGMDCGYEIMLGGGGPTTILTYDGLECYWGTSKNTMNIPVEIKDRLWDIIEEYVKAGY